MADAKKLIVGGDLGHGGRLGALDETGQAGVRDVATDLVRASAHHLPNGSYSSGRQEFDVCVAEMRGEVSGRRWAGFHRLDLRVLGVLFGTLRVFSSLLVLKKSLGIGCNTRNGSLKH